MNIDLEPETETNEENNETILDFYPNQDGSEPKQIKLQDQEADLYMQIDNESECIPNDQMQLTNPTLLNQQIQQEDKSDIQPSKKANNKRKRKRKKKKKKIVILSKEKPDKTYCTQSLIKAKKLYANDQLKKRQNKFTNLLQNKDFKGNDGVRDNNILNNNDIKEIEKSQSPQSLLPKKINTYKRKSLKPIIGPQLKLIKDKEQFADRLIRIKKGFIDKQLHNFTHDKIYSYIILPGNSCYQIKNCMKHRVNWREAQNQVTSMFNFKWKPTRLCIDFNSLSITKSIPQIVNHFECHSSITKKSDMFINLFAYCEANRLNVFQYVPLTILHTLDNDTSNFEVLFNNIESYLVDYKAMSHYREVNRKMSYANLFPLVGSGEMGYKAPITLPKSHYSGRNMWVVKATNLNRGQCIRVVDSIENLRKVIKTFQCGIKYLPEEDKEKDNNGNGNGNGSDKNIQAQLQEQAVNEDKKDKDKDKDNDYQTDKILIQKYIENPLLYQGRKCDIRIWVLVTQDMEGYVFKEGHLKTCSVDYDPNAKDASVHITNYSYQKHCDNFSKFEIGNEVPFHDFQSFLDTQYQNPSVSIKNDLMPKMKEIISASLQSVKDKLNPLKRNYSFELFGYDFMIDNELNVYLIEINTNPGIEESSPWIKVIIPRMLDDCLRLTIDKLFPPKYCFKLNNKSGSNTDKENYNDDINHLELKKAKSNEDIIIKEMHSDNEAQQSQSVFDMNKLSSLSIEDRTIPIEEKKKEGKEEKICNTEASSEEKSNGNSNNNSNNNEILPKEEYISPYPVPGYSNSENLWELVCDLNKKKNAIRKEYTGIKHLLSKRKKEPKTHK